MKYSDYLTASPTPSRVQQTVTVRDANREAELEQQVNDLKIKIGLHSGFPVEENNDLFGTSVQVAARVCDHAGANQILLTHDAKERCKNHNFEFQHIESARFKGVSDEVSLYEFITKF